MKEGVYITRVWPSGRMTMGISSFSRYSGMYFKSLEDYDKEGGVKIGGLYGIDHFLKNGSRYNIQHHISTQAEINCFQEQGNLIDIDIYKRDNIINEILND
jgi:hypothetical protein